MLRKVFKVLKSYWWPWKVVKGQKSWKLLKGLQRLWMVPEGLERFRKVLQGSITLSNVQKVLRFLKGNKSLWIFFYWVQNILKRPYIYRNVLKDLKRFMKEFKGYKGSWIMQEWLQSFGKISMLKCLECSLKVLKEPEKFLKFL